MVMAMIIVQPNLSPKHPSFRSPSRGGDQVLRNQLEDLVPFPRFGTRPPGLVLSPADCRATGQAVALYVPYCLLF